MGTNGDTEVPLYLGYMYGARSWNYENGRLTGLIKPHIWAPGINDATCWAHVRTTYYMPSRFFTAGREDTNDPEPIRREGHSMLDCACGFYAYNEESDDFRQAAPVSGVVRMHGRIVRGGRGLRGEHAEIVALYFRTEADVELAEPTKAWMTPKPILSAFQRLRVQARYRNVPIFEDFDDMVARFPVNLPAPKPEKEGDQWG